MPPAAGRGRTEARLSPIRVGKGDVARRLAVPRQLSPLRARFSSLSDSYLFFFPPNLSFTGCWIFTFKINTISGVIKFFFFLNVRNAAALF